VDGENGVVWMKDAGMMVSWNGRMVNKAIFVHFGTKPHTIEPKNKKALRWVDGGVFRFAKKVRHPGYRGDPFLYDAARATLAKIEKYIDEVI